MKLLLGPQRILKFVGLLPRAQVDMDPVWSLGGQVCLQDLIQQTDIPGMNGHVSWWVSRWRELLVDLGWQGLEPSHRSVSESAVRLQLFGLPLQALMGTCFLVGPCVGRTVHGLWLRGTEVQLQGYFKIYSWTKFGRLISRGSQTMAHGSWSWATGHFRVHS